MRASGAGKRTIGLVVLASALLCAAVSCSSDKADKHVQTPGAAGESEGGAAGEPTAPTEGGAGGKTSVSSAGAGGDGGFAGELGAAGQIGAAGAAGASSGFTSIAEADFDATFAKLFCDSVAHCCAAGAATCVDTELKDFATLHANAKADNNVYNPARAAECANAIVALGEHAKCTTFFMSTEPSLLPCRGIFDGTAAPGDACNSPTDCQRGLGNGTVSGGFTGCAILNGEGVKRCRQFVASATLGDPCKDPTAKPFDGPEGVVHLCVGATTCVSEQCAPLPAAGQACPGGSCYDAQCTSGTCVGYQQLNQGCADSQCESGLECDANVCKSPPVSPWILDVGFYDTTYVCPS